MGRCDLVRRLIGGKKYLKYQWPLQELTCHLFDGFFIVTFFPFQEKIYYIVAFISESCCKKIQSRCSHFTNKNQCKIYEDIHILDLCVKCLLSISGKLCDGFDSGLAEVSGILPFGSWIRFLIPWNSEIVDVFSHVFSLSFPFRKALLFIATCIAVGVAQVPEQGENALFVTGHLCDMLIDKE